MKGKMRKFGITISVENDKPALKLTGRASIRDLLQLLKWAEDVLLSQEMVGEDTDMNDVQKTEHKQDKQTEENKEQ